MKNRRQHYRHEFAPTRHVVIDLQAEADPRHVQGELINLSTGGMCVYATSIRKALANQWVASLPLGSDTAPLTISAERVYIRETDTACCGFRFLEETNSQAAQERERAIWKFLLDEQRRRWRFLHGE